MFLWLKVIHVLAVMSWMAGLFYLPRLMVYHADKIVGSEIDVTFKVMERRLLKAIMRPAALVALFTGFCILSAGGFGFASGWVHVKLAAVLGMVAVHGMLEMHVAQFARDERKHGSRYFRILNEVPTVLLVVIVIAVVIKPFG